MHLDRHVAYWASQRAGQPFMTFRDSALSWDELDAQAAALAAHLSDIGVQPGDRVGILLSNCLEWCVGFAANLRIGAITVPLNARYGMFELQAIAHDAECAAILSRPSEMKKLDVVSADGDDAVTLYQLIGGDTRTPLADIVATGATLPRHAIAGTAPMILTYTSGTTGLPKGIVLTHDAVEAMTLRVGTRFGWELECERLLHLAPLAFTGGVVTNLCAQIVFGGSGWLVDAVDPAVALEQLTANRITMMAGVPALWERVAAAPGFEEADISALKTAITGGAPVPMELVARYARKGVVIRQQFGVSENSGCVSCPDREGATQRPHSCGAPLPGISVEIRDEQDQPVPVGTVGEICLQSPQLMLEYWRNPEATAAAMRGGWYHTGDLGRLDEHGGIIVADRKKNMIISGGVNIYPAEIERAMMTIDGIIEVVVFGLPSPAWGQEVTAIVHAPTHADQAAILARARDLLGSMKAPKRVVLSPDRLPRTSSDKIARNDLQALHDRIVAPA
jgi:fatty-acyl-CoA synthase